MVIICGALLFAGSGKTTMLDMLAGRIDRTKKGRSVTGNIQMAPGTSMRLVQKEDSLVGVLTVKETLVEFYVFLCTGLLSIVDHDT